ncbi:MULTISPECIES: GIY-YIG nuclease family protein [unclassified Mesorhizobium]|uniref:GIY-YIG nuclease family protein n=1 Tax=unclassified Mesorhizobium TaxID=325217 RepID=UPI00333BCA30
MEEGGRLIRNYGLFWRKHEVDWKQRRHGRLIGLGVRKINGGRVDFSQQRGIYALYDDTFRLIYVGQAGGKDRRLYPRLRKHAHSVLSERWTRFSWFGICDVDWQTAVDVRGLREVPDEIRTDRVNVLNHLEAILIMAGEPIKNLKGGIFGKDVTHFRQVPLNRQNQKPNEEDFSEEEE